MRSILIVLLLSFPLFAQEKTIGKVTTVIGDRTWYGSCVVIDKEQKLLDGYLGYLATALHVVSPFDAREEHDKISHADSVKVEYFNGKNCINAQLVGYNVDLDLAILYSWIPDEVPIAEIANSNYGVVSIYGHPLGGKLAHKEGNFIREVENFNYSDIFVIPGYSGGGLFQNNKLVGIIQCGWFWTKERHTWPTRCLPSHAVHNLLVKIKNRQR